MYCRKGFLLMVISSLCLLQIAFIGYHALWGQVQEEEPPHSVSIIVKKSTSHPPSLPLPLQGVSTQHSQAHALNEQGHNGVRTGADSIQRMLHCEYDSCSENMCLSRLSHASLLCHTFCNQLSAYYSRKPTTDSKRCRFVKSNGRVPVALVSVPGSGNTWVRGMLEKVTGVCTGSIYCDVPLRLKGFAGEYIHDGSVLLVKTHTSDYQWIDMKLKKRNTEDALYGSAILLIRNPFDTIVAERHRSVLLKRFENDVHKFLDHGQEDYSHVDVVDKKSFGNNSDWKNFSLDLGLRWKKTIIEWSTSNHTVLVVKYEDLKGDSLGQVMRMLDFLGHNCSRTKVAARLKGGFIEFRRKHGDSHEYYTDYQKRELNGIIMQTINTLKAHNLHHLFQIKEYVAP